MGVPTDPRGIATAIALTLDDKHAAGASDQQPELFADADDAPMPLPAAKGVSGPKGGRPANARNRSTEEWRRFFLSKYRSPLIVAAEMYSRSPIQLARELGLYKFHEGKLVTMPVLDDEGNVKLDVNGREVHAPVLDTGAAVSLQAAMIQATLPYVHQKQPLAIEPKGDSKLGILVLGDFSAPQAAEGEGLPIVDAEAIDVSPKGEKP